jgi:putative hemolysin
MLIEAAFLMSLILVNGALAMSEIAVISARPARLAELANTGRASAARALKLASDPTRFLSTVQVGITAIGILSGAIGEATVAVRLRGGFERVPALAPHAEALSVGVMVVVLTYVSLIFGELVPKRLALTRPEWFATLAAAPMHALAAVAKPMVYVLTRSTDAVVRLLGVRTGGQPAVTHEEIRVLLEQGTREGTFEQSEREMMTNVLELDQRSVSSVLTPRAEVVFLDTAEPPERMREKLRTSPHSVLPLCDGGLDQVIGFVRASTLLGGLLETTRFDPAAAAEPAHFVPHSMNLMQLLQQFKKTHLPLVLVIDEYGGIDGLVTLTDVVAAIVGERPVEPGEEPAVVRRADGSWLVEGALDVETVSRLLEVDSLHAQDRAPDYHTVGGLAMDALGRVPRTGDVFERAGLRFEVVDMDGNRVDRVLVTPLTSRGGPPPPP